MSVTGVKSSLAEALRDRYTIQRELGCGGMATVYLARDLRHDRPLALKVLHSELAAPLGSERFLREIRTTARLQHPHILPVYDSGEAAGQLWYTMPFVEGESLRERLGREGRLPAYEAVSLAREVADALDYAHSQGVVHRDVKPENILLSRGHALVADFGVAKALQAGAEERLTKTGLAVGTPAYMSPEQVSGDPVDACSDFYALGCVLYEMLAGEPPFTGASAQAIMFRRCTQPPPRVRALRGEIPEAIDEAVNRALAQAPSDRFPTAAAFAEALSSGTRRSGELISPVVASSSPERHTIAVLPFANLSPESENEYFSDGMTDEIINALARVRGLRVAARSSCFAFKGKDLDAREIGRRLKVSTLVEGSVRKVGHRVRLTAQLIDAEDGYQRWTETYDRTVEDVFALQEELSRAIVSALPLRAAKPVDATLVKPGTDNLEAYTLYLRGRYFANKRTADALRVATSYFEQAIGRDPAYSSAHTGLATCWALRGFGEFGDLPPREAMPKAKAAAAKAIEIDSSSSEAHSWLAAATMLYDWDWTGAEAEFKKATEADPTNAMAHVWYAVFLAAMGRHEESIPRILRAHALDPVSLTVNQTVGRCYVFAGEYDKALEQLRAPLEMEPHHPLNYAWMARAHLGQARWREALEEAEKGMIAAGRLPGLLSLAGHACGQLGMRRKARSLLEELRQESKRHYVSPTLEANILGGMSDLTEAFRGYDLAFEQRCGFLVFLRVSPDHSSAIRSDPRFAALLKKVGTPV